MQEKSVITRSVEVAGGVYAPGHLGELTQIVDFDLVDAVLEETRAREKRLRLLPSRVVVYFVLALALFEHCSYRATWGKLTAALGGPVPCPAERLLTLTWAAGSVWRRCGGCSRPWPVSWVCPASPACSTGACAP